MQQKCIKALIDLTPRPADLSFDPCGYGAVRRRLDDVIVPACLAAGLIQRRETDAKRVHD